MHQKYQRSGLEILAFPCSQFGGAPGALVDSGDDPYISEFIDKYGIQFHMMAPVKVNGPDAHPVYKFLTGQVSKSDQLIVWNFEKFLLDANGNLVKHGRHDKDPWGLKDDLEWLLGLNKGFH